MISFMLILPFTECDYKLHLSSKQSTTQEDKLHRCVYNCENHLKSQDR